MNRGRGVGSVARARWILAAALLLALFLLLPPAPACAQQGTITYNRSIRHDFDLPDGFAERVGVDVPSADVTPMVLLFDSSGALLRPDSTEKAEPRTPESDQARVAELMLSRLRRASTSRSDQESVLETYVSYEDETMTETRELLGRKFLITGPLRSWSWKLTGDEAEFLGYRVQKAVAERDSTSVEAWFTPEIPVPAGPGPYVGLPGMILVVSVNGGHTQFAATKVSLAPLEKDAIRAPTDGDRVSRDEYERIVAEKLDELRATRRRRGGGDHE